MQNSGCPSLKGQKKTRQSTKKKGVCKPKISWICWSLWEQAPKGLPKTWRYLLPCAPKVGYLSQVLQGLRWQLDLPPCRGSPHMFPSLWPSHGSFSGQVNPFIPFQGFAIYLQSFPYELSTQKTAVTGQSHLAFIWHHQPMHNICTVCELLLTLQRLSFTSRSA